MKTTGSSANLKAFTNGTKAKHENFGEKKKAILDCKSKKSRGAKLLKFRSHLPSIWETSKRPAQPTDSNSQLLSQHHVSKSIPAWATIRTDFGRLGTVSEASHLVVIPIVRLVHDIAVLGHVIIVILELVFAPIPA